MVEAIRELTKALKSGKTTINEKSLADINGTIGNVLLKNRDEIFEQPSVEALRGFIKNLFDSNGIDTPDSRKYILKLQNMRNLGQAQILINNIMMKSQGLGMNESAEDDAEFNTLLQKEKELKNKVDAIKRDIDSIQMLNLKKGIPADAKTEIENLTSEIADLEKTANDPTAKNKKRAENAIKSIQGRIQKMREYMNSDGQIKLEKLKSDLQSVENELNDVSDDLDRRASAATTEPAGTTIGKEVGAALDAARPAEDPSPITDEDWSKIDAMNTVEEKVKYMTGIMAKPGLTDADKKSISDDIDFVIDDAAKSMPKKAAFNKAKYIQEISYQRELTKTEINEFNTAFAQLDDAQKDMLYTLAYKLDLETPVTMDTIVPRGENADERQYVAGEETDDEFANMRTVIDINKNNKKFGEYVPEPDAGKRVTVAMTTDPDSPILQKRDLLKTNKYNFDQLKQAYVDNRDAIVADRAKKSITDRIKNAKNEKDKEITKWDWINLLSTLSPDERERLKQELLDDAAGDPAERGVIKTMFDNFKIDQDDVAQAMGYRPGSGGVVQIGDRTINLMMCIMAEYYGVATDEATELRTCMRSQNQDKRDRCKELRPVIFDALVNEVWDGAYDAQQIWSRTISGLKDLERDGKTKVSIEHKLPIGGTPNLEGDKAEKRAADLLVGIMGMYTVEYAKQTGDYNEIKEKFEAFDKESRIVKIKTGLDKNEHTEYIKLVDKAITDRESMSENEKVRLIELDLLRKYRDGRNPMTDIEAHDAAIEIATNPNGWKRKDWREALTFDGAVDAMAKTYMKGGSGNYKSDLNLDPTANEERN